MLKGLASPFIRYSLIFILAASLIFKIFVLYKTIDHVPRMVDEPYWMQGAYFYDLFFLKHDFLNKDWQSFISYDQPPVSKYILGFALDISNHKIIDTSGGLMDWQRDCVDYFDQFFLRSLSKHNDPFDKKLYAYNRSLRSQIRPIKAIPLDQEDFKVCRRTIFLFAILSTVLLIIIGAYVFRNIFSGLLAGQFFLTNNLVINNIRKVLIDPICCFFVLCVFLVFFWLFHELKTGGSNKKVVAIAILEGLLLSLALGAKLITTYAALTLVLVFIGSILLEIFKSIKARGDFPIKNIKVPAGLLFLVLTSTFTFFVLLNPFLYSNPISGILKMDHHRFMIMKMQIRGQPEGLKSFSQRLSVVYNKGILLGHGPFNVFESSAYLFIFISGLWALMKRSMNELSAGSMGPPTILLLWMATVFILNGLMVNMSWDRYYIPFVMCTCLILGSGAVKIMTRGLMWANLFFYK